MTPRGGQDQVLSGGWRRIKSAALDFIEEGVLFGSFKASLIHQHSSG